MVRIGEFSPLNPNLNSGRPLLGLGEYEERRKALLEQRKREYFQALEQARLLAKSGQVIGKNAVEKDADLFMLSPRQVNQRTVATQTNIQLELPLNSTCVTAGAQTEITASSQGCGDINSDDQMRQILYREELRKQIEEKQKLEAMKREREKLEEAVLEERVRQQQEEMAKQYEEELARRTAVQQKKREQEEALHQRLAEMQQEAIEYREKLWRQRQQELKMKISEQEKENQLESEGQEHGKELRNYNSKVHISKKRNSVQNKASGNLSSGNIKSVSRTEQKINNHINNTPAYGSQTLLSKSVPTRLTLKSTDTENVHSEHSSRKDENIRAPAFGSPTLLYKSVPTRLTSKSTDAKNVHSEHSSQKDENIRDAIPLIPQNTTSLTDSPPVSAVLHRQRTNSETLDDKWQVPVVEKYVCSPLEKSSIHNGRVLTQLGAFRKQLQQERLLLQQKIYQPKNGS